MIRVMFAQPMAIPVAITAPVATVATSRGRAQTIRCAVTSPSANSAEALSSTDQPMHAPDTTPSRPTKASEPVRGITRSASAVLFAVDHPPHREREQQKQPPVEGVDATDQTRAAEDSDQPSQHADAEARR